MIAQSYMPEFMLKLQTAAFEERKTEAPLSNSSPQFKNILSSAVNRQDTAGSKDKGVKEGNISGKKQDENLENTHKFKAYREISLNGRNQAKSVNMKSSTKATGDSNVQSETDSGAEKLDDSKINAEAAVESIAQVLGAGTEDLVKMLVLADIKAEDLTQEMKSDENAAKLAGLIGLNKDEQQTLAKVINLIAEQIVKHLDLNGKATFEMSAAEKSLEGYTFNDNHKWMRVDNSKIMVDGRINKDFSELMAVFKLKLQALAQEMKHSPQRLEAEIADRVEEVLVQVVTQDNPADEAISSKQQEGKVTSLQHIVNKADGKEVLNKLMQEKKYLEADAQDGSVFADFLDDGLETKSLDGLQKETVRVENYNTVQFSSTAVLQRDESITGSEIARLQEQAHVQKNEIINQVVEKARVILDGEKSEMIMELKPDSLGKLFLKVVTEHGMVTAKFIAESQQVKQILEANMQILKDSLEKQGMSIQGFSVSVGQDSSGGFESSKDRDMNKNPDVGRTGYNFGRISITPDMPEIQQNINLYNWNLSRINLTA